MTAPSPADFLAHTTPQQRDLDDVTRILRPAFPDIPDYRLRAVADVVLEFAANAAAARAEETT